MRLAKGRGATPTSPRLCFQTIDFLEPPGSRLPCAPPSRQVRRRAEPRVSWPRRSSARMRTGTSTPTRTGTSTPTPCCAHAPRPAPRSAHPLGLAGRTPAPTRFASVPPVRGIRKDRGATCPSAVAALTRVRPAGVRRAAAPPRVLGGGGCESEGRRRLGARLRLRGVRARGEACGASSSGLVNDPVSHPQADSGARSPWARVRLATFKGTVCEQCV